MSETRIIYSEPEDYFPKEIREKFFPELCEDSGRNDELSGNNRPDWKPVSELTVIDKDISENASYEPLEVKLKNGVVCFRESNRPMYVDSPKTFKTQFGVFNNHDNGEFHSWLGKGDKDIPEGILDNALFPIEEFSVEGNYCDMFDCGDYAIAVSNLRHMASGEFNVIRIDRQLEVKTLFENENIFADDHIEYEYLGRYHNENGYYLIISGYSFIRDNKGDIDGTKYKTLLLTINPKAELSVEKEWNFKISSSNSIVAAGNDVYFGQNRMITRLNIENGDITYMG